ncbi:MAG TPA: phosphoribosyltransferase family protein [Candidatus Paceibacterota bacterium]
MGSFLKNFVHLFKLFFELAFTNDDPRRAHLKNMNHGSWRMIAELQKQSDGVLFIFAYENKAVKDAISLIKNKNDQSLAKILVEILSDFLLEELSERVIMENFENPAVVAIPATSKKKNRRGFNPSELLAKTLSETMSHISFLPNILIKIRETLPQKELSRSKRLTNVKNSMIVDPKYADTVADRCIIVIDDVTTTGATFSEARRALHEARAKKILCIALAH